MGCECICVWGMPTPDDIIALHQALEGKVKENHGNIALTRTNISGDELDPLEVDTQRSVVADIRRNNCKLLLPDGQILSSSEDPISVAQFLTAFVDLSSRKIEFHIVEIQ